MSPVPFCTPGEILHAQRNNKPPQPMPKFLKILLSLAMVMAVFYFTSTPSPTTTLVRLGFLAALIGFTLFSVIRRKGKDEDE